MNDEIDRRIGALAAETEVLRIALRELSTHLPTIAERADFVAATQKQVRQFAKERGEPTGAQILEARKKLRIR